MGMLMLGIVLLLCKWLEFGWPAQWSWWIVLAPFGLAVVWWSWADGSGYTKRRAMEREDQRKQDRIDKSREALGLLARKRR